MMVSLPAEASVTKKVAMTSRMSDEDEFMMILSDSGWWIWLNVWEEGKPPAFYTNFVLYAQESETWGRQKDYNEMIEWKNELDHYISVWVTTFL